MTTLGFLASVALASVLAAEPDGLSIPPPQDHVFGGVTVPAGGFEGVVAISVGTGLCTGTLLTDDLVLTAAHCFRENPSPSAVEVIIGNDVDDPDAVLEVEEWGAHPCAAAGCAQDGFDIAYVKLAEKAPMPAEGFYQPIYWQAEFDELAAVGATVRVVGFGQDLSGQSGIKRSVDVEISGFRSYGYEFEAGGAGRDSCEGDSGGPALGLASDGRWRIVGVLSRGFTCGSGGIYVVPLPSLCWAQQASGHALVPDWCGGCGCLDLDPDRNDEGGCRIRTGAPRRPPWLLLPAAIGLVTRRGRGQARHRRR